MANGTVVSAELTIHQKDGNYIAFRVDPVDPYSGASGVIYVKDNLGSFLSVGSLEELVKELSKAYGAESEVWDEYDFVSYWDEHFYGPKDRFRDFSKYSEAIMSLGSLENIVSVEVRQLIYSWGYEASEEFTYYIPKTDQKEKYADIDPNDVWSFRVDWVRTADMETKTIKEEYQIKEVEAGQKEESDFEFEDPAEDATGMTFVVSGKLELFDNLDDLTCYIGDYGGKVVSRVSSKTNYLVCNDMESTTSNMKKAKELGVPIITEREFVDRFCCPGDFELNGGDGEN